ncbi:uncharacterized protein LOC144254863 [Urocitellus parryii]
MDKMLYHFLHTRENIKLMVVKRVDKGKDDTPVFHMAESHLGKSSHEEQRGLKCAGHSKKQNDSEQHQEMCAASESVEINASTKEGISTLGKEPHLDRSSEAEQKSFHDIDDTAHRQQKSHMWADHLAQNRRGFMIWMILHIASKRIVDKEGYVTLEDAYVYFSWEEWELLAEVQRFLNRNVMLENFALMTMLGCWYNADNEETFFA